MEHKPVSVGVIGCGNISGIYLESPGKFPILNITACADLDVARAEAQAAKYGIAKAYSVEELLADPEIEIVINLTIPQAHAGVAMAAHNAGKSVYNEKPLSVEREDARKLLELAEAKRLLVGCAPDTFLGAGFQTARAAIDSGKIGQPVGAQAFFVSRGPEAWHPNPAFFYERGAGPMFDMGPYYLTAMTSLLGPVRRVTGTTRISFPQREIGSEPFKGQMINVTTPTHVSGLLEFASGPVGSILCSFDVWASSVPRIEIFGSEGTLILPDPNFFDGPVQFLKGGVRNPEPENLPLVSDYTANNRGLGVADMAYALRTGRQHRASGALAFHVLDIMHAIHESSAEGRHISLESSFPLPAPLAGELKG